MRLYKLIQYRLAKKDTPLKVIERIRYAFSTCGIEAHDIKFYATDMQRGSISGIDRLLKDNPLLSSYHYKIKTSIGLEQRLSNLPAQWTGANPDGFINSITMDDAVEMLSGIPRRYPINDLTFIFDKLPILRRSSEAFKDDPIPFVTKGEVHYTRLFAPSTTSYSDYPSPCIRLQSDWGISGRINFLDAIIEIGEVCDDAPKLELTASENSILSSIGDIYHERVFAVPSNAEEAKAVYDNIIIGEQIVQSCYDQGNLIHVKYPYSLRAINIGDNVTEPLSIKKAITSHFKKRGFSYNSKYSNGGLYTITKLTKNYNMVKITFIRGKFSADVSCEGSIEGPLWMHKFDLPETPYRTIPYQITQQKDVDHLIENIAAAYDTIEKTIGEAIDDLYGVGPSWLTYL